MEGRLIDQQQGVSTKTRENETDNSEKDEARLSRICANAVSHITISPHHLLSGRCSVLYLPHPHPSNTGEGTNEPDPLMSDPFNACV